MYFNSTDETLSHPVINYFTRVELQIIYSKTLRRLACMVCTKTLRLVLMTADPRCFDLDLVNVARGTLRRN